MMTAGTRFLIVNADDFGQSPGINRGIIKAHADGIVTSVSLMVRWPASNNEQGQLHYSQLIHLIATPPCWDYHPDY